MAEKIIIDTDPGIDDMLAIFYALASEELEVIGLTSIFGNVTTHEATLNALRLLEIAGRTEIPVAQGASCSLTGENNGDWPDSLADTDTSVHGNDGLGNTYLPLPETKPTDQTAVDFIVEQVQRYPGEVTLVPIGPLTNLALAFRLYPRIVSKVKRIVLMGGAAFVPGNVNPASEANIFSDPEAADIVFKADWDITMLGLDVTEDILLSNEQFTQFAQSPKSTSQFICRSLPVYLDFYNKKNGGLGCSLHDPSVIAYLLNPSLFEEKKYPVTIGTRGSGRGKTWAWLPHHFWETPVEAGKTAAVVLSADTDKVVQNILDALL